MRLLGPPNEPMIPYHLGRGGIGPDPEKNGLNKLFRLGIDSSKGGWSGASSKERPKNSSEKWGLGTRRQENATRRDDLNVAGLPGELFEGLFQGKKKHVD